MVGKGKAGEDSGEESIGRRKILGSQASKAASPVEPRIECLKTTIAPLISIMR
jgi:hypothetical protein